MREEAREIIFETLEEMRDLMSELGELNIKGETYLLLEEKNLTELRLVLENSVMKAIEFGRKNEV